MDWDLTKLDNVINHLIQLVTVIGVVLGIVLNRNRTAAQNVVIDSVAAKQTAQNSVIDSVAHKQTLNLQQIGKVAAIQVAQSSTLADVADRQVEQATTLANVSDRVELIHKNTNSLVTQLVAKTEALSFAAGVKSEVAHVAEKDAAAKSEEEKKK